MRNSLKKSLEDSRDRNFESYPKGSIVLCNACALPLFKLDGTVVFGRKAGGAASLFKPLSVADLLELAGRTDIDAGIRARVSAWTTDERRAHVDKLVEPKAGDLMACPFCFGSWAQVLTTEQTETHDRAYTLELLTIPPVGLGRPAPVRGKQFAGDRGDWLH